ncbi:enoyl-CoA hydratase-related protein [Nocardia tengchongensis]|uniref:enoyl-CoA hydratase-related protein n=1 Tax=Nocardia tengchongensis TaxID=2055889 RepID=UPI0036CBD6D3
MRILLVAGAFDSLTQRVRCELDERGHRIGIELALGEDDVRAGARAFEPDLIVGLMLADQVPADLCARHVVLQVNPGPEGDHGPSSLDWAIGTNAPYWSVTVQRAVGASGAGPVWASETFPMRLCGKSELYRTEVADAAVRALLRAIERFERTGAEPIDPRLEVSAPPPPPYTQYFRRIDWAHDSTATVLRKLRAADSNPGVLDQLYGREVFLHGGHLEDRLRGVPGSVIATRDGAICRATVDGAVWIPQLRARPLPGGPATYKLPATEVLGPEPLADVPDVPVSPCEAAVRVTWSELRYYEYDEVGYLGFTYAGGALSTAQCERLLAAYRQACARPVKVLVLGPARDFFCNGIQLNVIEAAADPAAEAWRNVNAFNDLVEAILTTTDKLVISALPGNSAAGGVMLALAADEVWCRESVVLNPHYRLSGLRGSKYWTYTMPRRVGAECADRLTGEALPIGARSAARLGLVDRVAAGDPAEFRTWVRRQAAELAAAPDLAARIDEKRRRRAADEAAKPLAVYRSEELEHLEREVFDPASPFHRLRHDFVTKAGPRSTPAYLLG